jgi:hypothetical protein
MSCQLVRVVSLEDDAGVQPTSGRTAIGVSSTAKISASRRSQPLVMIA